MTFKRWFPFVTIALIFTALLAWSFQKWADPIIDIGRELYVAWALASGKKLYTEVAYLNGPLSPYFNAGLFWLFGPGLSVLTTVNALILATCTALIYRLLRAFSSMWSALAACAVFLCIFAFAQLDFMASFNFMAPYSHEATHGFALALAAMASAQSQRFKWMSGLFLGLLALTKLELFLAGLCGFVFLRPRLKDFALAALPPLLAVMALGPEALVGQLRHALNPEIRQSPYYQWMMGTQDFANNLSLLFTEVCGIAGMCALLVVAEQKLGDRAKIAAIAMALGLASVSMYFVEDIWWTETQFLVLVPLVFAFFDRRREALAFCAFALVLLLKIFFNVRTRHYGFVLVGPSMMLLLVLLLETIPKRLASQRLANRLPNQTRVPLFASVSAIALATFVCAHVVLTQFLFRIHETPAASGRDKLYTDGLSAGAVNSTLAAIEKNVGPHQTFMVFPEGAMLNYLTKRQNPTPFHSFMPVEISAFGEDTIVASLAAAPPDFVFFYHKDTSVYGVPLFGKDYGFKIYDWLTSHYRPIATYREQPLQRVDQFGVALWQRL